MNAVHVVHLRSQNSTDNFFPKKKLAYVGFYLHPSVVFGGEFNPSPPVLLLGPFAGRPACLEVSLTTNRPGVCASSWLEKQTILVPGKSISLASNRLQCLTQTSRRRRRKSWSYSMWFSN